jgi:squalene-hopene/tetraprenyl-beta-curcumene cyclase
MKATIRGISAGAACFAAGLMGACSHSATADSYASDQKSPAVSLSQPETGASGTWSPKNAAAYLDRREVWWMGWKGAARDHQTFCISCHTVMPYALSRPVLGKALAEEAPSGNERKLLENVRKRVRLWKEVEPFYEDQDYGAHKGEQSRGTEAVLNALVLASYDARSGRLSEDTRTAFENMWALQHTAGEKKGAWSWLQFDLEPWEASDSPYYGAALAGVAVGTAPENYRATPGIQNNVALLREYLNRESAAQAPINRVVLLWASTKWPGLLGTEEQKSIINEVLSKQQADGGWSLAGLSQGWRGWHWTSVRSIWKQREAKSDGYATGLIVLALQQAGVSREDTHVKQGVHWLELNQSRTEGRWLAYSLNKERDPGTEIGRFMSDAATAYAVLALSESSQGSASQQAALGLRSDQY